HTLRYYTETGKDSVEMTLDTYSWYVKGIRYPIFESIKTTLHRLPPLSLGEGSGVRSNAVADTTVFHTSFYYSPDELKTLSDAEQNTKDTNGNPVSEAETVFTEARLLPNPVVNNLNIDFKIWFTVHNNIGVPMLQTTPQTLNKGKHYTTIPMNKLHTGTYTVYVHVDDMMVSRVVVKK
ncbi:MAG: hypothetical protein H6Q59_3513, partial [Firmicutes bacterium]|nr:hypothetical protein [Bacillota bacterium]